jgi:RNA polymerase sigma-70 factor (ECF subfamily)
MSVEQVVRHRARSGHAGEDLEGILGAEIPRLLRLAERLSGDPREAEDLTQETLLRALRKRPDLGNPDGRRAYLTRILVNLWRTRVRNRARRREAPAGSPVPDLPARDAGPVQRTIGHETTARIREALHALPPGQRAALVLRVDEGLSVSEIARSLGSTPDRVKANLWHARQKLKEKLADLLGQ